MNIEIIKRMNELREKISILEEKGKVSFNDLEFMDDYTFSFFDKALDHGLKLADFMEFSDQDKENFIANITDIKRLKFTRLNDKLYYYTENLQEESDKRYFMDDEIDYLIDILHKQKQLK